MIVSKELQQEFHENGALAYENTIAIIEGGLNDYPNHRIHPDGYKWIRIGRHVKYHDNGQLEWLLNYNERGDLIEEKNLSYNKDGTIKTF